MRNMFTWLLDLIRRIWGNNLKRSQELLILVIVSVCELTAAFTDALTVHITPDRWAKFEAIGLCGRNDQTLLTLVAQLGCGLLVSGEAFVDYFLVHWLQGLVVLLTAILLLRIHLPELRKWRSRARRSKKRLPV